MAQNYFCHFELVLHIYAKWSLSIDDYEIKILINHENC